MSGEWWAHFFGEPWPSGICDDGERVATPVGQLCLFCETQIGELDQGSFIGATPGPRAVHRECSLRSVLGGYGHHTNHAYWCVEMHDPDGGLGYRESALRVWALHQAGASIREVYRE